MTASATQGGYKQFRQIKCFIFQPLEKLQKRQNCKDVTDKTEQVYPQAENDNDDRSQQNPFYP